MAIRKGNVLQMSMGNAIQAFPLYKDKVNLTSGDHTGAVMIHCAAAGDFTITWPDNTTSTITAAVGDDYTLSVHTKIVIDSGTFHIA